jgi:hypothetical protein
MTHGTTPMIRDDGWWLTGEVHVTLTGIAPREALARKKSMFELEHAS